MANLDNPMTTTRSRFAFSLTGICLSLLVACALVACARASGRVPRAAEEGSRAIAFVGVNVVSMQNEKVLAKQTVIVLDQRITQLGPRAEVAIPPGATVIDGAGKHLMPGLADMHMHLPDDASRARIERVLALSLSQGVTTVRGMQGAPSQLEFRARSRTQGLVSPLLYLAGPPVAESLTVADARARVRAEKEAGYDYVKVLGGFDKAAYQAIVEEARALQIAVAGHVPDEIGLDAALAAKQSSIEHLMGYVTAVTANPGALDDLVRRTVEAGIWNCPTLDYFAIGYAADDTRLLERDGLRHASPGEILAWKKAKRERPRREDADVRMTRLRTIVAALAAGGARLLVGSDSPGEFSVPGYAYVEELTELARAGLRPYVILEAATRSAAEYLGKGTHAGMIAVGAEADLVLLDRNPLERVENVAHPAGVMLRGRWLPREELERQVTIHASEGAAK